jgi:uncharacterized DUF497 family protein
MLLAARQRGRDGGPRPQEEDAAQPVEDDGERRCPASVADHHNKVMDVVHAEVQQDAIRIISARRATSHEKKHYEND